MKTSVKILFLIFLGSAGLQAQDKYQMTYDTAGNQIIRRFCSGNCNLLKKSSLPEETIAEQFDDYLIMFPNPTSGQLHIKWDELTGENLRSVTLINSLGMTLQVNKMEGLNDLTIDLRKYPTGIYFARFNFSDKSTFSQQIIKK